MSFIEPDQMLPADLLTIHLYNHNMASVGLVCTHAGPNLTRPYVEVPAESHYKAKLAALKTCWSTNMVKFIRLPLPLRYVPSFSFLPVTIINTHYD